MVGRLLVLVSCVAFAVPSFAAITGIVMNADGQAVAGARISAHPLEPSSVARARLLSATPDRPVIGTTQSDKKGRFSLDTPKEHLVLNVLIGAAGYAPHITLVERDEEMGAISLTGAAAKTGRVTAAGKPVAGARVSWSGMGEAVAITDESGRYTVPDPSKWARLVTVIHPDYAIVDDSVVSRSTAIKIDRTLDAGVTIAGRVIGPDGRTPVAGAALTVDGWPAGTSGEDGSFSIERVPSAWRTLAAHAKGLSGNRVHGSELTVRMQPAVTVTGIVRDTKTREGVATAQVSLIDTSRGGQRSQTAISDARGNFSIENVTPGSYLLTGFHPSFTFAPVNTAATAGDRTARTLLGTRRARVAGFVLDENKKPVAGARVVPQTVSSGQMPFLMMMSSAAAMSAPDGSFILRINPDADVQVEAVKKGHPAARSATVRVAPGERKGGITITIPSGVTFAGRVVDGDGNPVAGVTVAAAETAGGPQGQMRVMMGMRGGREDDLVRSSSEGTFSMALKPGSYDFVFRRDGFATRILRAHQVTDGDRPLEVTLEPGAEITGRVTRGGQGLAGVSVSAFNPAMGGRPDSVETAADGSFRISDLTPGDMMLSASKRDEFIQEMRPVKAPARDVEIEVPPGGRISGRVVDKESKQPVTSFTAGVSRQRGGGGMVMMMAPQSHSFTSDDGSFVLENVPPGVQTLAVNAPGYTAATLPNIAVEEGKTTQDIEVAVERGVRVTGRVTGPDGAPLSGVAVRVNAASGRTVGPTPFGAGGMTDDSGSYTLESVAPGEKTLMFFKSGYVSAEKTETLSGREARVDAQLTSGLRVNGTVVSDSGAPVADAFVSASAAGGAGRGGNTRTDQNGAFQLEGLAPGRYTFRASKTGHAGADLRDVDISSGAPIRLVFKSGGTVYGRVTGLSADEMVQTTVQAMSANGGSSAPVDASGNYRIEGAPTGTVRLTARVGSFTTGRSAAPKSVEVTAGATVQQDIEFNTATSVRGRVTRDGQPVPGAIISFSPRDVQAQTSARTQADSQGHYEVTGLDDATYNVMVGDVRRSSSFSTTYEVRGSGTFDIAMRAGSFRGRVVDGSTGEPIDHATVQLRQRDTSSMRFPMATLHTDAAGGFTLQEVSAGSYQLTAEKEGYGSRVVDVEVGDATPDVEVKLTPNAGVALRVVDARDGRVLSPTVRVFDMQDRMVYESPMRFGGVSADTVRLGIAPGTYRAVVTVWGYAPQDIRLTSPGTITVGMTPGGSIAIRSRGNEMRRGRLVGADGREYQRGGTTGIFSIDPSPGLTQIEHVAPGIYTLQILGSRGEVTASAQVSVREGGRTEVEL